MSAIIPFQFEAHARYEIRYRTHAIDLTQTG